MAVRIASGAGGVYTTDLSIPPPYTLMVWGQLDTLANAFRIFATWDDGSSGYDVLFVGTDGTLKIYTPAGNSSTAGGYVLTDVWGTFVLKRTSNTRTAYILQARSAITNTDASSLPATTDVGIMVPDVDTNASARDLCGFKAWSVLLTDDEIAQEAQQLAAIRTSDLISSLVAVDHTDLIDAIGAVEWASWGTLSTVDGPSGVSEEWDGPTVGSLNTTAATSSSGGLSINMPASISAGDLLMAFAANDTSVSWSASAGWEKIDDGANGSAVQGACWAKIAAGSDTLTITGEANDIAVVTIRIPAAQHGVTDVTTITKGTAATGSSNAPNGPNCNPGTSGKWLWLTYYAADDDDDTAMWWPVEGAPVAQVKSATGTSSCQVGVAYRWLEASSYDPSAFALSASEEWRAQTFAIPAAASGSTGTLAATESGSDTAALAGDVLVEGSLAATESGSDVAALAGDVYVSGTLAATESGSDVAAIEGTALIVSTGTLDATESGADTAEIVGVVLAQGTLAANDSGEDTAAITGVVLVSGTLDATEAGSDTAVIAAVALVQGSLDATESGSDTAAIEGSLAVISTGSLAATESGSDTATFAGVAPVSGALAATEAANDSAAVSGVVLVTGALDATETGSDTAAFASSTPVTTAYPGPAGRATKGKRRRVIIGERLYEVLERDIPALLEAELLDRAPPTTAEVIEGPKPRRKRARKAPQPVKTVEQVRETVQQIKRRIEPDDAWLAQALEAVAFRVLERLQDEEDSLMLLLAA